jgi:hypothetical protein
MHTVKKKNGSFLTQIFAAGLSLNGRSGAIFAHPKKICYYFYSPTHGFIMKCRVMILRTCLNFVSVSSYYTEVEEKIYVKSCHVITFF